MLPNVTPVTRGSAKEAAGYRKQIGGVMNHLGSDEGAARRKAGLLAAAHEAITGDGGDWHTGTVKMVLGLLTTQAPEEQDHGGHRLYPLLDDHADHLDSRGFSPQHSKRARETHRVLKRLHKDVPLSALDRPALCSLCDTLLNHGYKPVTIRTTLSYWRLALSWAVDTGRWSDPPNRWERLLSVRGRHEASIARNIQVIAVADLRKLYQAADARLRLCILLGLNCGFTQLDIGTLTVDHIIKKGRQWFIQRERNKTGCWGCWWLWPETVALLREQMGGRGVALRNRNNKPVCYITANGRREDSIRTAWDKARDAVGVKASFKLLRKTGATLVAAASNDETASRYLSHTPQSVGRRHYIAPTDEDFAPVHAALKKVRRVLMKPVFKA